LAAVFGIFFGFGIKYLSAKYQGFAHLVPICINVGEANLAMVLPEKQNFHKRR
jgi:hypothetical protein